MHVVVPSGPKDDRDAPCSGANGARLASASPLQTVTRPPLLAPMAQAASFDVTTGVDLQEVDNAINQAQKEVVQRPPRSVAAQAGLSLNSTNNDMPTA